MQSVIFSKKQASVAPIVATLCYLREDDYVLFALKKEKICAGCFSTYGGKVEDGDSITESLCEEVLVESGVMLDLGCTTKMAVVNFYNYKHERLESIFRVHIFVAENWTGKPTESAEMGAPAWYDITAIPFYKMSVGDQYFLIPILRGKKVEGEIHVDYSKLVGGTLLSQSIREVFILPEE